MSTFSESATTALALIVSFDTGLWTVVGRSLAVSATACAIACGIGALFTIPIAMVISSNYGAHVYREYVARGGEAVNIAHVREADPNGSSVGPRPQAF